MFWNVIIIMAAVMLSGLMLIVLLRFVKANIKTQLTDLSQETSKLESKLVEWGTYALYGGLLSCIIWSAGLISVGECRKGEQVTDYLPIFWVMIVIGVIGQVVCGFVHYYIKERLSKEFPRDK